MAGNERLRRPAAAAGFSRGSVALVLLAAPDLPLEVAERLAPALPDLLSQRIGAALTWQVSVVCDSLTAGEHNSTEMIDLVAARMAHEGWDLAVCLSDLPVRIAGRPIVADVSVMRGVALVSLPALGARRLGRRAPDLVVGLVAELVGPRSGLQHGVEPVATGVPPGPGRRVEPPDEDVDARYVASLVHGHLDLVAGMVRANRPWRLMLGLSSALAAALATSAIALVTDTIWLLADQLGVVRLLIATVGSLAILAGWPIFVHDLWERPVGRETPDRAVLYNTATVLTLVLGVSCLYVVVFLLTFVSAVFVIDQSVLQATIGHPVNLADYVVLAWATTSLAMVGGALGSGLEDREDVREAAYGYRQRRRSTRASDATTS